MSTSNDIHNKLMYYSGKIRGNSDAYYIYVPNADSLNTIYLRKDRSIGISTMELGANESTRGFWESYEKANEALAIFQKSYRIKKLKMKKKIANIAKNKGRSPLIRAGLFKSK